LLPSQNKDRILSPDAIDGKKPSLNPTTIRSTTMRQIRIGITAIALVMVVSVGASGQTNRAGAGSHARQQGGKALVKKLPAGLKGVQLSGNKVRVKAGYKFVKQDDGTVAVARIKGGGSGGAGLDGKWSCNCDAPGTGSCDTTTTGTHLICSKGTCSSSCTLTITTTKGAVGVFIY
jgi:hypothetical protein